MKSTLVASFFCTFAMALPFMPPGMPPGMPPVGMPPVGMPPHPPMPNMPDMQSQTLPFDMSQMQSGSFPDMGNTGADFSMDDSAFSGVADDGSHSGSTDSS